VQEPAPFVTRYRSRTVANADSMTFEVRGRRHSGRLRPSPFFDPRFRPRFSSIAATTKCMLRSGGAFYALDFGGTNGIIAHLFPTLIWATSIGFPPSCRKRVSPK
jgi:hypothetical protein